jgi:hypothetical protein
MLQIIKMTEEQVQEAANVLYDLYMDGPYIDENNDVECKFCSSFASTDVRDHAELCAWARAGHLLNAVLAHETDPATILSYPVREDIEL